MVLNKRGGDFLNLHEILFASKMNGNSVDFSNYVKNTDFATKEKVGLMRPGGGLDVRTNGVVEIASATNAEISAGTNNYKPIVPANLASAMSAYGIISREYIANLEARISSLESKNENV